MAETLKFALRNFAKVRTADVVLDGITVIVGENNSGKSTVGKTLYSLCSVLSNLDERVHQSKLLSVDEAYDRRGRFLPFSLTDELKSRLLAEELSGEKLLNILQGDKSYVIGMEDFPSDLRQFMKSQMDAFVVELERVKNIPFEQYRDAVVWDYFDSVFHSQVLPVFKDAGKTSLEIVNGEHIKVGFDSSSATVGLSANPGFRVCYINGPTAMNLLNSNCELNALEVYDRELTEVLRRLTDSPSVGLVGARKVANRARMKRLREIFDKVLPGSVRNRKTGKGKLSVAVPGGREPICFENLSSGLKSFVLIWHILDQGLISDGDVLILDEPEVRMHPEWQIVYAELIALLCKIFKLRILLTSHSVDFIHALKLYVRKYRLTPSLNLYKSVVNANGSADIKPVENKNWDKLFDTFVRAIDILSQIQESLPEEPDGQS